MAERRREIKVKLVRSLICTTPRQRLSVRGLGLQRVGHVRTLVDTPATRGLVAAIPHLVTIVTEKSGG